MGVNRYVSSTSVESSVFSAICCRSPPLPATSVCRRGPCRAASKFSGSKALCSDVDMNQSTVCAVCSVSPSSRFLYPRSGPPKDILARVNFDCGLADEKRLSKKKSRNGLMCSTEWKSASCCALAETSATSGPVPSAKHISFENSWAWVAFAEFTTHALFVQSQPGLFVQACGRGGAEDCVSSVHVRGNRASGAYLWPSHHSAAGKGVYGT
jgi:hypothetical protein